MAVLVVCAGVAVSVYADDEWGGGAGLRMNPRRALPANLSSNAITPYRSGVLPTGDSERSEGRTRRRLLYSFEDADPGTAIEVPIGDRLSLTVADDHGVSHGERSARVNAPAGDAYSEIQLGEDELNDWADFDYLAVDLFSRSSRSYSLQFELWDKRTRGYTTRYTISRRTKRGRQTLLFPISQPRRNGKSGLQWEELRKEDKINLNALRVAKIFFKSRKRYPAEFWIDNIRLLQEDAAIPQLQLALPAAVSAAFDFGSAGAAVPGFTAVPGGQRYDAELGYGFSGRARLDSGGQGWPDMLGGTYVKPARAGTLQFRARIPDGEYLAWLCAGKIIQAKNPQRQFLLRVNDKTIYDHTPTRDEFDSESYMYRFMWTQYSVRPHADWLDYIERMYEAHRFPVTVENETLRIEARNFFVSGLILMPREHADDFQLMSDRIRQARMAIFEKTTRPRRPYPLPGWAENENAVVYVPDPRRAVRAHTLPMKAERVEPRLELQAARDENVFARVAVAPFADLGPCVLRVSDLKGPDGAVIASAQVQRYVVNWRGGDRSGGEMGLLPTHAVYLEPGLTQCFWLWLRVPADAKPGAYKGVCTLRFAESGAGEEVNEVPVKLTVLPFRLESELPVSLGMYYGRRRNPAPQKRSANKVLRAQFGAMRRLGFTSVQVPGGWHVRGIDLAARKAQVDFDPVPFDAARGAGLGALPEQFLLVNQLGSARTIARRLPGSRGDAIDHKPGLELQQPEFKGLWFDTLRKYKAFLDEHEIPYAMEIVDEPREAPLPWNRNLTDTLTYAGWMGEIGLRRFVTLMADVSSGRDYTTLVDHTEIVSIHGHKGAPRIFSKAYMGGKSIWFYNIGMDRFKWGFYPWAYEAVGRFEWHWCFVDGWLKSRGGYPGREWFNPFTPMTGNAPNAPITDSNPGGFLYTSALFTAADGITDYAYLVTLQKRVAEVASDEIRRGIVDAAQRLLRRIRSEIRSGDPLRLDLWRKQIAAHITALQ